MSVSGKWSVRYNKNAAVWGSHRRTRIRIRTQIFKWHRHELGCPNKMSTFLEKRSPSAFILVKIWVKTSVCIRWKSAPKWINPSTFGIILKFSISSKWKNGDSNDVNTHFQNIFHSAESSNLICKRCNTHIRH